MDIAAMSTMMSQAKVQQQVGFSVMKMVMNSAESTATMMAEMLGKSASAMERSVHPHIGGNIDIKL